MLSAIKMLQEGKPSICEQQGRLLYRKALKFQAGKCFCLHRMTTPSDDVSTIDVILDKSSGLPLDPRSAVCREMLAVSVTN